MKKRLPNHKCHIGHKPDDKEMTLGFYRDQVGSVNVAYWKCGEGFTYLGNPSHKEIRQLHKWLTKIIEYQDRP